MIKLIALIEAKPGISPEAFRKHYEERHVPLARRLLPMVKDYCRNYLDRAASGGRDPTMPGIEADAITEVWFETEEDCQAFFRRVAEPEVRAEIAADEAEFIYSKTVRMFRVEECR